MGNEYYELYMRFPQFKTKALTLSFDDGTEHDRRMVEILNRYGIPCTFNLSSANHPGNSVQPDEYIELYRGHEVASHSLTHPHLWNLDTAGIVYQMISDRARLEEVFQKPVRGFAYPFGLLETDGMVDTIKKCGIKYARTTVSTHTFDIPRDFLRWHPTCHQADSELEKYIEAFLAPDDIEHPWRIRNRLFYIWGHSYEYANNWEKLEKMCKALSGRQEVWYATNIEVADYITAFDLLERSANGRYLHNPTDKTLYCFVNGKNFVLESGKTYSF